MTRSHAFLLVWLLCVPMALPTEVDSPRQAVLVGSPIAARDADIEAQRQILDDSPTSRTSGAPTKAQPNEVVKEGQNMGPVDASVAGISVHAANDDKLSTAKQTELLSELNQRMALLEVALSVKPPASRASRTERQAVALGYADTKAKHPLPIEKEMKKNRDLEGLLDLISSVGVVMISLTMLLVVYFAGMCPFERCCSCIDDVDEIILGSQLQSDTDESSSEAIDLEIGRHDDGDSGIAYQTVKASKTQGTSTPFYSVMFFSPPLPGNNAPFAPTMACVQKVHSSSSPMPERLISPMNELDGLEPLDGQEISDAQDIIIADGKVTSHDVYSCSAA